MLRKHELWWLRLPDAAHHRHRCHPDPVSEQRICRECGRCLVTIDALARALHSGCALLPSRHEIDVCPSRTLRIAEARSLWKYMEKEAKLGVDDIPTA